MDESIADEAPGRSPTSMPLSLPYNKLSIYQSVPRLLIVAAKGCIRQEAVEPRS